MIASAIPQAIRQYSMEVAPDSSLRNFEDSRRIQNSSRRSTEFSRAHGPAKNLGWIGCERIEEHAERSIKAETGICWICNETKRKAIEGGAEGLLTKPIDFTLQGEEIDTRLAGTR
jgi:hypothetical protein